MAAESMKRGKRNARINGIITPLANDELNVQRGNNYKKMINLSPIHKAGTPDEVRELSTF